MSPRAFGLLVLLDVAGCTVAATTDVPSTETQRVVVVHFGEPVPDVSPPDVLVFTGLSADQCDLYGGRYMADGSCYGVDY